jgi:hypothetical protein
LPTAVDVAVDGLVVAGAVLWSVLAHLPVVVREWRHVGEVTR